MISELIEKFSLSSCSLISITGGGGKTSLMFTLGKLFAEKEKVLITTTTHIKPPSTLECDLLVTGGVETCAAEAEKQTGALLCAAGSGYEGEKLIGFEPPDIDLLAARRVFGRIIVEADGSRGLPFKAYEDWEPPVPSSSGCQMVVAGADALTIPAQPETVFRFALLRERYQIAKGENLSLPNFAAILSSPFEYLRNSPRSAFRLLVLNRCDLLEDGALAQILADLPRLLRGYDALAAISLRENKIFCLTPLKR